MTAKEKKMASVKKHNEAVKQKKRMMWKKPSINSEKKASLPLLTFVGKQM